MLIFVRPKQFPQHGHRATQFFAPGVCQQAAALRVRCIDPQMNAHVFLQTLAPSVQAQHIHRLTMQAGRLAGLISHALIHQNDFHGFRVIGKQVQMNIVEARSRAAPDGPAEQRPKFFQPEHPRQRQFTQRGQFLRLGIPAKKGQMFPYSVFHEMVVGQRGARWQPQRLQGAMLGRSVFQSLLYHQACCCLCDGGCSMCHGRIVTDSCICRPRKRQTTPAPRCRLQ